MNHPKLNIPAFTFEEDDSIVETRKCCELIPSEDLKNMIMKDNPEFIIIK